MASVFLEVNQINTTCQIVEVGCHGGEGGKGLGGKKAEAYHVEGRPQGLV